MSTRRLFAILFIVIMLFFTSVPVAYAHDCSSAEDCSNVVKGTGWLAGLLGMVLGATAATKRKKWKTKKKKKKFKDCKEAVDFVKNAEEVDSAEPKLDPTISDVKVTPEPGGTFKAEAKVTWSLSPTKSSMTETEYSWNNMSEEDKAASKNFSDAVQVHEEGHMTVAEQVANEASTTVEATGDTEAEAKNNLQKELNDHQVETQEKLDKRTNEYDEATDHGRKQSKGSEKGFPGGKDVRLDCP